MRIDWYTRAVLTIIAAALVANVAQDYVLPARAADVQRVAVCNAIGTSCASVSGSTGLEVLVSNSRDLRR